MANTISQKRPDVTSHFKMPYLDDAGYHATIFTDSVEKGTYQLGLAIKNSKGEMIYQPTDKVIKIHISEFSAVEKAITLPPVDDIQWGLDYLINEDTLISISGWAALKNQDSDHSGISLVFKKGDEIFLSPTEPLLRPDVSEHFKKIYNLDKSGFTVKILKEIEIFND